MTALMTAKPDEGTEHTRAKRSYSCRNGTTAIPAAERPVLARKAALARWGIKKLPPKKKPPLRGR